MEEKIYPVGFSKVPYILAFAEIGSIGHCLPVGSHFVLMRKGLAFDVRAQGCSMLTYKHAVTRRSRKEF